MAGRKATKLAVPRIPTYLSMGACSKATGVPMEVMSWAKEQGCPAFKFHRVEGYTLIFWLFNRIDPAYLVKIISQPQQEELQLSLPSGQDQKVGGRAALDEYRAQREKIRLERDRDELASKSEVKAGVQAGIAELFATLERVLCNELPPTLIAMRELEIRKKFREVLDGCKVELKAKFGKLAKEEESQEPPESDPPKSEPLNT